MLLPKLADTTPCSMETWLTQGQGHFLQHWFGSIQHWPVRACSTPQFFVVVTRPPHDFVVRSNIV